MSDFDIQDGRVYVARLNLPEAGQALAEAPEIVFDQAKQQALVVGSDVVSFDNGVESEFREAVSDAALLAQLAANHKLGADADPMKWFDAYFEVLGNLGWVIQTRDTATYKIRTDGMEVHEAILDVVAAFLGSAPAAIALIELTLKSLKSMNKDSPLITLFEKQSQHAHIGRFQFTVVHKGPDGGLLAEAMAFALDAKETVTQILFFKLHGSKATLRRSLGQVSLNRNAMTGLKTAVRKKVEAYLGAYVAELDIG